ncbi:TetR family transcriptional regulator [Kribbella sp. VKM Ac-2527]|uniref:TetR family transcriptional regulator n=1 Tax=Kribbella caucasensis TaxID=2512215 RepID=A0A4R6KJ42_9ACTN|nr:TetR/AcrR family transcriptional regulator [Kribbella sp. VKM Ac-2527]TDO49921.1 TetR family transcriptional regulator [Kribbella sp. VKM Ac-2527]
MTSAHTTTPARRGPYAKSAQRRAEIIEVATRVFASRGYHGGSLRDIARQLGVSLRGVVHHFPSKSELLEAVLEHADQTAEPWFSEHADERGIRSAIVELVEVNFTRTELLRLLAIVSSEASAPDHPAHTWFVKRYEKLTRNLTTMIDRDVSAGRIQPPADPEAVAQAIVAAWDGLQLQWLLAPHTDMVGRMTLVLDSLLPATDD